MAVSLLQENHWNVESAVNQFFERGMGKVRATSGPGVIGVAGAGGISGGMSTSQQAVKQSNSFVSGPGQPSMAQMSIPNEQEIRMMRRIQVNMPQMPAEYYMPLAVSVQPQTPEQVVPAQPAQPAQPGSGVGVRRSSGRREDRDREPPFLSREENLVAMEGVWKQASVPPRQQQVECRAQTQVQQTQGMGMGLGMSMGMGMGLGMQQQQVGDDMKYNMYDQQQMGMDMQQMVGQDQMTQLLTQQQQLAGRQQNAMMNPMGWGQMGG
jgi:hypothetical protein